MLLGTLKRTIASAVMATATHARRARRSKCPCRVDGGEARVLIPPVPRSILLAPYLSQHHTTALPSPKRYGNRYEDGSMGQGNELRRIPIPHTSVNKPIMPARMPPQPQPPPSPVDRASVFLPCGSPPLRHVTRGEYAPPLHS